MATMRAIPTDQWASDFFGGLNEMPHEPVEALGGILETMGTEPTFRAARRAMLADLALAPGGAVLEAGAGTGVALPDVLEVLGPQGRVLGVDPTVAFVETARRRAERAGAVGARYETGDARALPAADGVFDAAFCDKILIHVGPPEAVLGELTRVTRPGGRVGALEWEPHFALSGAHPEVVARFNDMLRGAVQAYSAGPNLARYFRSAGLIGVQTRAHLAHARSLDEHPFWRAFLVDQLPLFVHAGLLAAEDAETLAADLGSSSARGELSASFVVFTAMGTKPA